MGKHVGRLVLLTAVLALCFGIFKHLSAKKQHLALTNNIPVTQVIADIASGSQACQQGEVLPEDVGAVRLHINPRKGRIQSFTLSLEVEGKEIESIYRAGSFPDGMATIDLRKSVFSKPVQGTICVTNEGREPIILHGFGLGPDNSARVDGKPTAGRMRIDYMRAGEESWFSLIPRVAERFSIGKFETAGVSLLIMAVGAFILSVALALTLMFIRLGDDFDA